MRLKDALTRAVAKLSTANVPSPRLNAETLLMFTLGSDRSYLYAHPEHDLSTEDLVRYDAALSERARGIPAQYITGHQEFWGLDLIVSPAVLIPRPETEHIIETVLHLASEDDLQAPRILDVGTGSGAIALALAHELGRAEIHACDISPEALEIAQANAARLELDSRVQFRESDLLTAYSAEDTFDFIVSNPPYVAERDFDSIDAQVRRFEPHRAVFGGEAGFDVYRKLIPQAREHSREDGWLVMEIGAGMEDEIRAMLDGWREIGATADLQGITRVLAARK